MKNIFFIMICSLLYCNIIWGQCTPLEVSTDPQNPFNEEVVIDSTTGTSPFLNNFDWQTYSYNPANYVPNGFPLGIVQSPFTNTSNVNFFSKLSTNTDIKDYYVEDGWELINENITNTNQTDLIYFILYNKYSSILRVLFAMEESSAAPFTTVSVKLEFKFEENINAMLHPSGGIGQPLDRESEKTVFVSVPIATNDFHFMIADFPVEYDPCVCFKESLSDIDATFELVQQQTINLTGTDLSMSNSIANISNGSGVLDVSQFLLAGTLDGGNVTAGNLIFQSIDNLIAEYDDLQTSAAYYTKKIENLEKAKTALKLIATAAAVTAVGVGTGGAGAPAVVGATAQAIETAEKLAKNQKATSTAIKATSEIAKGLSPFADYFSYQAKAEKDKISNKIDRIGNASVNFGIQTISGTITTTQPQSTGITMAIPGGQSTTTSISSDIYPKYNNVLGRIAVLETPKAKVAPGLILGSVNNLFIHSKRIGFDASTLDYVFNPAAGIIEDETVIFAAIEVTGQKLRPSTLHPESFYNIDLSSAEEDRNMCTVRSEFVPLSCLSDLSITLTYLGDISSEILITEVKIKLVINYAFDQIGRSGAKNRAIQIITYPTEIQMVHFTEIPEPISNNGTPIPTELVLNSNQNFTSNTTIFAWEKIIIDADLTAAAGVNVEIIAPEIIVKSGRIGSGIRLMQGFYPHDCSPLSPVSQSEVSDFCSSNDYKANQSKYADLANNDNKPKPEKVQVKLPFHSTPNPFTNTFNIEFELESESTTSLVVFDALGRVVETVIANDNLVAGQHLYQIDGSRLESGFYFIRLQTDDDVQTIKVMKQ